MIQKQNFEAAYATMAKIYTYATPDQVDLKVSTYRLYMRIQLKN